MDTQPEIVYCSQDLAVQQDNEMHSQNKPPHPQKLPCRRTALPQPASFTFPASNLPFYHLHGNNTMPLPPFVNHVPYSSTPPNSAPPVSHIDLTAPAPVQIKPQPKRQRPLAKNEKLPRGKRTPKGDKDKAYGDADSKKPAKGEKDKVDGAGKYARWEDKWTVSLIHIRGEMQDEFSKPPKQGVNLWTSVWTKLVSACPDFDKDHEACRKKWKSLYNEYKEVKAHNNVSGNDRADGSQWYLLIDEYMGSRANVCKAVHGAAISEATDEGDVKVEEKPALTNKKTVGDKKNALVQVMEKGRQELLQQMAIWEGKRVEAINNLQASIAELVKKI